MLFQEKIKSIAKDAVKELYGEIINAELLNIELTPKEFDGDYTIVIFPILKIARKSPEIVGEEIGKYITRNVSEICTYNIIKGYLNLTIDDRWWIRFLDNHADNRDYGFHQNNGQKVLIEYCSPNTNKPLHLGHLRNIFLGNSIAKILEANGTKVIQVCLFNDRGVHISKSMLSWERWGNGETPQHAGIKGDHLIGKYYVRFQEEYNKQEAAFIAEGGTKKEAITKLPIILEIKELTSKWEANDPATRDLWKKINGWVYEGIEDTFKRLSIKFDKYYYESETYKSGKDIIKEGLKKNIFFKKGDGSVWIDLTESGLDEKILLRSDGTSVYITQDIGTAQARHDEFKMDRSIYVVADEQDYHFRVLFEIIKKLDRKWAKDLYHLSYGMVDLPSGKMKSREGTVVDADTLMDEMNATARVHTIELGKIDDFSTLEAKRLYETIGLGALKFFLLKVDPKKRMLFDPEASIDFHGHTGPFIQYTYARIQSLLRKWKNKKNITVKNKPDELFPAEKDVLVQLYQFQAVIIEAGELLDPSVVANYTYRLAKLYNKLYAELPILKAAEKERNLRITLSKMTGSIIKNSMMLLGIEVPEKM